MCYPPSMPEQFQFNNEAESKEQMKGEYIGLAKELSERAEAFAFPGVNEDSYAELKATEEEGQGYITPIDDIVVRLQDEGIKVVLGEHPENGDVYILPQGSSDIQQDSILPRHLMATEDMEPELRKLVDMNVDLNRKG